MLSESSEKTYKYYINCYTRWCSKNGFDEELSLDAYKTYLKSINRSDAYIRNSVNVISKTKNITVSDTLIPYKSSQTFTNDELQLLKNACKTNYKAEEISLLLLILFETDLKIKDVLRLTKLDVHTILSKRETVSGKRIPHDSLYIFEYVLCLLLQKEAHQCIFTKTYHCYLHNFKTRQKDLFPNKPYRAFNAIYMK